MVVHNQIEARVHIECAAHQTGRTNCGQKRTDSPSLAAVFEGVDMEQNLDTMKTDCEKSEFDGGAVAVLELDAAMQAPS